MSAICGVYNSDCSEDKFGCSACEKVFHFKCVDGVKTRSKKDWKCNDCRIPSGNSSVKSSTEETGLTREFIVRVMEDFKRQISTDMNNFRKEIGELTTSLQMLSDSVEKSSSLIKEIKMENAAIKKENEELRATSQKLSGNVAELQDRIRTLEQYTRRNNIEVSGIPTTPEESIMDIVQDVGKALGLTLQEGEINAAHRVPSFRKDGVSPIIVQFHNRSTRDSWIEKYRKKKTILANDVNPAYPKHRTYVSEHLSPANKQFLSKIKQKCKEINYKFAWFRDGKFYVRKSEGEKCMRVDSVSDIQKLK